MVATESNRLPSFKNRRALSPRENEPRERKSKPEKTSRAIEGHLQTVGWISRQKTSQLPAEGEVFLLTSPLQKLLHVCAIVIWRPSLAAFFLRNSICCRRYLCS